MTTVRYIASSVARLAALGGFAVACASGEAPQLSGNPLLGDASSGGAGAAPIFGTGGGNPPVGTGGNPPVTTGGAPAGGGSPSMGSCNPDFCPSSGMGAPCCVSPNGPCGVDVGQGCVSTTGVEDAGP